MLPIMASINDWYEVWGIVGSEAGSFVPEVIPEDVLWIDETTALIIHEDGTYLSKG